MKAKRRLCAEYLLAGRGKSSGRRRQGIPRTAPVGKEDMKDFEPGDDGEEPEGSSSGGSFEELSQTIGVLGKKQPSDAEKQKATSVLYNIDGTELFNFITINEIYTQKARTMMAAFNGNEGISPDGFDMNEYMD